jgi:hypothetical protein
MATKIPCKPRRCLSCCKSFSSTGLGNRICRRCKGLDAWNGTVAEFSLPAVSF